MLKLRRWYNQNKKKTWQIILIVAFLIIILQLLNFFTSKKNKIENNVNTADTLNKEYTDLSLESDKSVLLNKKITNNKQDSINVINEFFSYCNSGKIKEAYNLLTNECKETMYPELKYFRDSYYKTIFNGSKKNISLENWVGDIYKIGIGNDILSTGQYDENSIRQEYITVKKVDNNYKLNINKYIGRFEINKYNKFDNNVEISVEKKDIYMDYEIYTFKIRNNRDNPILLDNLKDINSMYLEDKNNLKYQAYTHEMATSELLVNARESKILNVKYYNKYGSEKKIKRIVFSKVITDYYSYINLENYNKFGNYCQFIIDI